MTDIVYCIDCKFSVCYRSGESAEKYGKGRECRKGIIRCPDDYDFCSRGEKIFRCKGCNEILDEDRLPNYCPNCGTKLKEVSE